MADRVLSGKVGRGWGHVVEKGGELRGVLWGLCQLCCCCVSCILTAKQMCASVCLLTCVMCLAVCSRQCMLRPCTVSSVEGTALQQRLMALHQAKL